MLHLASVWRELQPVGPSGRYVYADGWTSGADAMRMRTPIVADRFYPGEQQACREALDRCIATSVHSALTGRIFGGVVPHAGWICSGTVAARTIIAVASAAPDTVICFGAVHRASIDRAAVVSSGVWPTPIGDIEIDAELADDVLQQCALCESNIAAHQTEHSLEVQMPFIKRLLPEARVLPVMVPPTVDAVEVGRQIGEIASQSPRRVAVIGTTDLTHYGPAYDFEPMGGGSKGLLWAKEVNDRRFINLVCAMSEGELLAEARRSRNACGAGAVAATIAASKKLGADQAVLLEHVTSREILGPQGGENAVGYAAVVFGADMEY